MPPTTTRAQTAASPAVSIIIPVFNKCDLTVQCLKALAEATTRTPHEIIVVDNASSDATPRRLKEFSAANLRVIRNEVNRGFAGACNQGAAAAAGKYLLFLNNDTVPVQGWLEPLVEEVATHPEVVIAGSKLLYESGLVQHAGVAFARETRSPFHPHRLLRLDDPRVNFRRELQCVTAACMLIRPKWFNECGGFLEEYRNGYEDLDLCLQVRKRGGTVVYQPKSTVIHLESQTPGRMKFDRKNRALFFQRWADVILSDEDAYYFEGGLRIIGRENAQSEEARLARFDSESEHRQWSVVARSQRLAAANHRDELQKTLAVTDAWPADAAVRHWAGALCLHLRLPDLARQHFQASLKLADNPELRIHLDTEPAAGRPANADTARWEAMARAGYRALRAGNYPAALTALDTALLRGAPPQLILPALQQAARLSGATAEAESARQALLAMPRIAPAITRTLEQAAPPSAGTAPAPAAPAPLVSIIVLALNQIDHTRKCVASLLAHTRAPFEVILVDNGSTDGTAEYFNELCVRHPNFKAITNRTNRGFAAGNNQGLAVAAGELFVLLNNDTIVTPGWVENLSAPLILPGVGLTGPVSNRVSGPQQIPTDYASDAAMLEFAKSWTKLHTGENQPAGRLVGFCLLFNRAVLDAIGGLDESFGSGNFEDDDFCIRARLAGFTSRIARDAFIHHTGSQTFKGAKIDYRAAMERNWDLFRTKWAFPAAITLETGYPFPAHKPEGVKLQVALPSLDLTHTVNGSNHWIELAPKAPEPRKVAAAPVAALGNLKEALALFDRADLSGAWNAVLSALRVRPFNPDAHQLLAEIALAAGDSVAARLCAQRARELAPAWKAPRQFLQGKLKGNAKLEWLKLPDGPGNRLSVCVIAKNEEKFLAQCLRSVKDVADQMVVVDTGSTDRTVEIAKELGAEVHHFEWCDDFSAARNAALEHATGDWILILDADEELPADQMARLRADLKKADAMALRIPLVDAGQEAQGQCFVPRLFRNAPGIFYFSRIHEQVFPSLLPLCKAWSLDTKFGTAQLLHHGYAKEMVRDRNKIERNLNLLRKAIAELPNDANLLMNLGLEIVRTGDLQTGLSHYREAFRLMSAQPPAEVVPELREVLLTQFTCHLYKVRAHEEVIQVLTSPLAQNGGLTASLHFALGLSLFELNQNAAVVEQMRQCLAKRKQTALAPINTDILTAAPYHCLALALAKTGDTAGAEKIFQAGLAETGRTDDLKIDYAKLLAAQNRAVEGLHLLHEVVQADGTNSKAWLMGGETALGRAEFLEFALDWTGEAIRLLPEDRAIVAQRAEALMMSQQTVAALPLWKQACNGERPPRAQAAWIICATADAHPLEALRDKHEELAVSRAFVDWYRRLVAAGAENTIRRLNDCVETLRPVIPSAAGILDQVIAQTRRPELAPA